MRNKFYSAAKLINHDLKIDIFIVSFIMRKIYCKNLPRQYSYTHIRRYCVHCWIVEYNAVMYADCRNSFMKAYGIYIDNSNKRTRASSRQ